MSVVCSTTQSSADSRVSSLQSRHPAARLAKKPQAAHSVTSAAAVVSAPDSASEGLCGERSNHSAIRSALRGPIPGRRFNCPISARISSG